ncbi:hypothetical protein D7W09_01165 [bacterium D16-34]|nr:hypothetical protein D7W09_01165 [bacterium D16-34]
MGVAGGGWRRCGWQVGDAGGAARGRCRVARAAGGGDAGGVTCAYNVCDFALTAKSSCICSVGLVL